MSAVVICNISSGINNKVLARPLSKAINNLQHHKDALKICSCTVYNCESKTLILLSYYKKRLDILEYLVFAKYIHYIATSNNSSLPQWLFTMISTGLSHLIASIHIQFHCFSGCFGGVGFSWWYWHSIDLSTTVLSMSYPFPIILPCSVIN